MISTRLGLRNARDVSLLNSICYSTVKLPKDHVVCVAAAETRNWQLQSAVIECRKHEEEHVKFYFRLSPAKFTFETNIMTALEQSRGDRLYGQAPRGSLERKALDLLQKLGVETDKPIGS